MGYAKDGLDRLLAERLAAMPEIELAYLFGSQVSGRVRRESDIDVAILVTNERAGDPRAELARLFADLGQIVPSERLDVVLLNGAPSLLRHRIIRDGRLLFARTPERRIRFVSRTIQDYQDMQVRRGRFYRRRLDRIREGKGDGRSRDFLTQARGVARLLGQAASLRQDE
jgi:hypothetical protein